MKQQEQEQLVKTARSWLGTKFHHQGRSKKNTKHKGAVDCIGLLIGIAKELEIKSLNGTAIDQNDCTNYSKIGSAQKLLRLLDAHLVTIPKGDENIGDIMVFKIAGQPQHVGILSDGINDSFNLIHCYESSKKVVEHCFSKAWQDRIIRIYRFKPWQR